MNTTAQYANVYGTCGLGVLFSFGHGYTNLKTLCGQASTLGTGFAVAGFINTSPCKRVYEYLTDNYELIYQSPVRRNRNSGNDSFFIIIDLRSKK